MPKNKQPTTPKESPVPNKHSAAASSGKAKPAAQAARAAVKAKTATAKASRAKVKVVKANALSSKVTKTTEKLKAPKTSKTPKAAKPVTPSAAPEVSIRSIWRARLLEIARNPEAPRRFAAASVCILLLTTLYWSVLTALLHQLNADQLIDAYLFQDYATFHGAVFPGAHSFLLKWPIFVLMSIFGNSAAVFIISTILMSLITVGFLAYILYKIERRPLVFGVLCLALASVLLLIPAQPYPGALLPVNMAMTTTRNLEYVIFITALLWALRVTNFRTRTFAITAGLLTLVIASDKLFLVLAAGAGLFLYAWYMIRQKKLILRGMAGPDHALHVLAAAATAGVAATGLLLLLTGLGLTNVGGSGTASPYSLIHTLRQFAIGFTYGLMAVFTNLGANPVHGTIVLQRIPHDVLNSLLRPSILSFLVNGCIATGGLVSACLLLMSRRPADKKRSNAHEQPDRWRLLSILLVGSTLAAAAVYVLTDHYYPVDARYLTVGLFTVFISAASYWRQREVRPCYVAIAAAIILIVLPLSMMTSWQEYHSDKLAMAGRSTMTARVSDELKRRKINRLVGNYWDITPVKSAASRSVTINPVEKCTLPRPVLNSSAWFRQPAKNPTAYLAVRDGSRLAGPDSSKQIADSITYGGCSLAHVVGTYGVPDERVAIGKKTGAEQTPDILLLLYPDGIKPPAKHAAEQSQVHPEARQLPMQKVSQPPEMQSLVPFSDRTPCNNGTSLQVVAHEDDDLLFMNPDVLNSIKAGRCIRTVYMTAGDAGEDIQYWGGREQGAKAAYAEMYGVADNWRDEQQMLAGHQVTVSYLKDVSEVALVFMHLPDGNIHGDGFIRHNKVSLHGLMAGTITEISPVDGTAAYSRQLLIDSLLELMTKDLPDQIRTQGSDDMHDGDHTDHYEVGVLTRAAADNYIQAHDLIRYMGYPDKAQPVNLSDDDITLKQTIFLAYAKFDGAVCQTAYECQNTYTYGSYLTRQYPL